MKTANLAIVFTDIKGFTERTSQQTLAENEQLLELHSKLLTPLFHAFDGRIVKSIGDAFMVTFESPTQAVLCGAAIQDRLWMHNRSATDKQRLDVRIAVNVGEVRIENKDVFGEPVNIASRVEGIAEAGEVFFTEAVYLAMNKAEVPSAEVGDFELKGIPGKIKVYRVPHAPYRVESSVSGTPSTVSPTNPGGAPFGNLGLARVKDESLVRRLTDPNELLAAGAQLQSAVSKLAKSSKRPAWLTPKLVGPAVVAIVAVSALVVAFGSNEIERSIDAVAKAPDDQRFQLVRTAEALIDKVKDPEEKLWYSGQLDEAQQRYGSAAASYKNAARRGSSRAERRIKQMIESDQCAARAAGARAAGDLRLKSAKSALEDLAEDGGPGEGGGGLLGTGLGSCDSRGAAKDALRQLE